MYNCFAGTLTCAFKAPADYKPVCNQLKEGRADGSFDTNSSHYPMVAAMLTYTTFFPTLFQISCHIL